MLLQDFDGLLAEEATGAELLKQGALFDCFEAHAHVAVVVAFHSPFGGVDEVHMHGYRGGFTDNLHQEGASADGIWCLITTTIVIIIIIFFTWRGNVHRAFSVITVWQSD